jgi:gas vesicle protein
MAKDQGGSAGAVFVAFLLGAVTGAAVALLAAPTSGEEARRRLSDKAREGKARAGDVARQGREFIERQRETITTAIERGHEAYRDASQKENG